jgi:hypothetical protein
MPTDLLWCFTGNIKIKAKKSKLIFCFGAFFAGEAGSGIRCRDREVFWKSIFEREMTLHNWRARDGIDAQPSKGFTTD